MFVAISGILSLFPVLTLPAGMLTALSTAVSMVGSIGYFFPLGDFAAAFLFCLAVYKLEFLIAVFHWVLRKIPGVN